MTPPPVILHADYFAVGPVSQGISHRAEQVRELLNRVGPEVVEVRSRPGDVSKIVGLCHGLRRLWVRGYRSPHRWPLLGRYGRQLAALVRFLRGFPHGSLVVWGVSGSWLVPHAASVVGMPVVAVPMMTEALIEFDHDVMGGGSAWDRLRFEVENFRRARAVVASSHEEQWFLRGHRVDADCLPIYPDSSLRDDLMKLRARREAGSHRHLLILSSHANPPNRRGVLRLAEMLKFAAPPLPVVLAGLETERFADQLAGSPVTIEGTVTGERLGELMIGAKAMLIHQEFGTGALTRIPEALVAGIPVVCNGIAARSAHHYEGVHTFETAEELRELLASELPTPPVPPRPVAAERRFVDTVRRVMGVAS